MVGGDEADELYETYALALVLRDEGLDDAAIAHAFELDEAAVAPLLATAGPPWPASSTRPPPTATVADAPVALAQPLAGWVGLVESVGRVEA
jgi:hypothetical protein